MALTYHVVPRFDIAAPDAGGYLRLGTVVTELTSLRPLNPGRHHVEVPPKLIQKGPPQTNVKATLAEARRLSLTAWVKALQKAGNASVSFQSSSEIEENVECEKLETSYFFPGGADDDGVEEDDGGDDSDEGKGNGNSRPMAETGAEIEIKAKKKLKPYIERCFSVPAVRNWVKNRKGLTVDLYLVTGLKAARNLSFNMEGSKSKSTDAEASGAEPTTGAATAGAKGNASSEQSRKMQFETSDIVLAYQVTRYGCRMSFSRPGERKPPKEKGVVYGNMQGYENSVAVDGETAGDDVEQYEMSFEILPVPGEEAAQVVPFASAIANSNVEERWIGPSA